MRTSFDHIKNTFVNKMQKYGQKIRKILSFLQEVSITKTFYFNIKYFPFKQAIKMPCFVYRHTLLSNCKGQIIFDCKLESGLLKLGNKHLGTIDYKLTRTMWEVQGQLILKGETSFGRGSKISIGSDATLIIGGNFILTGNSAIICQKQITFGDNCLLSWEILLMDTDFHPLLNEKDEIINYPRPIVIGNHVWIGCRCTILKGVELADHLVVAAGSTISKSFLSENIIIGGCGNDQRILKKNISWESHPFSS